MGWDHGWVNAAGGRVEPSTPIGVVARGPHYLDVVVTGGDKRIYSTSSDSAEWPHSVDPSEWWSEVAGITTKPGSPVGVVARDANHLNLFVADRHGHINYTWWNSADATWGRWRPIDGVTTLPGAPIGVVARKPDRLDVFVADGGGRIKWTGWNPTADEWARWSEVPGGVTTKPGAPVGVVARKPDHLDLFVTGADRRIKSTWREASGKWAGFWFDVADGTPVFRPGAPVSVVAPDANHLSLFVTDSDGYTRSTWWP